MRSRGILRYLAPRYIFGASRLSVVAEGSLNRNSRVHTVSPESPSSEAERSSTPELVEIRSKLQQHASCLPVNARDVSILGEPSEFYETLMELSKSAQERVCLSSLYLGTGQQEKDLVQTIHDACAANSDLKVTILLDFLRGTRGLKAGKSSVNTLSQLIGTYAESVNLSLYHTPLLSGALKLFAPERASEILGVAHMKLYIFDDTLIISGANLSSDYFTTRHDRYIRIDSKILADYFHSVVEAVASCSYKSYGCGHQLLEQGIPTPHQHPEKFREVMTQKMKHLVRPSFPIDANPDADTWIFPSLQFGTVGISQDDAVIPEIIKMTQAGSTLDLCSGYLNFTDEFSRLLLESEGELSVTTASPEGNGFFKAKGFPGYIPRVYSHFARDFLREAKKSDVELKLREYVRPGWTFHAKGLWLQPRDALHPVLTFVGSSNFGERSKFRDLEANLVLVTENDELQKDLSRERDAILEHSFGVTLPDFDKPERNLGVISSVLSKFLKSFL